MKWGSGTSGPWKKITRFGYMGIESICHYEIHGYRKICQHFLSVTIDQDLEEESVLNMTHKFVSKKKIITISSWKLRTFGPEDQTVHRVPACWEWVGGSSPSPGQRLKGRPVSFVSPDRWFEAGGTSVPSVLYPPSQALPSPHPSTPPPTKTKLAALFYHNN